jgi:nucleoside-diphosphate-sugar epimerase
MHNTRSLKGRRCLVTGAAGFIGSHLAERLLGLGCSVVGVDAFTDYYVREVKERNLRSLLHDPEFSLKEADLLTVDLAKLLRGVDFIFHQAGQPGVRASWGSGFEPYVRHNVVATQRLLEAARGCTGLVRFVSASSSSVYGDARELPVKETTLPEPVSPYGVTKLAAEQLCRVYAFNFGVPTISLRYFTVYGPRQRPDMGFHKFVTALLAGKVITVHGDGEQTRDFTYISDAIDANLAAATADRTSTLGRAYNIGGGSRVTVNEVIRILESSAGMEARIVHGPEQPGDARHTYADTQAARRDLGFMPKVSLELGLRQQLQWLRETQPARV